MRFLFFIFINIIACINSKFVVKSNNLYYNNTIYNIKGINWFGLETVCNCPHGLWIHDTNYYFDLIRAKAINSIRIPFSYEVASNLDQPLLQDCTLADPVIQKMNARQLIHYFFQSAKKRGITILLDFHTVNGAIQPYPDSIIPQEQVFQAWKNILNEYKNYENLIGIDVKNEPHGGINWTDWSNFVKKFIDFINKNVPDFKGLFWVEGIEDSDNSAWGGSFQNMKTSFGVNPNQKIVFSPHVYGVSVRGAEHINDGYNEWESWFGFLNTYYDNLVCIGEIGGLNGGSDYTWHQNILKYLQDKNIRNFYYWCLNPNSFDTSGVLGADWSTVDQSKIDFMYNLQPNPTFIQF